MSGVDEILEDFRCLDERTKDVEEGTLAISMPGRKQLEASIGGDDISGIAEQGERKLLVIGEGEEIGEEEEEESGSYIELGVDDDSSSDDEELIQKISNVNEAEASGSPLHRSHLGSIPSIIKDLDDLGLGKIKDQEDNCRRGRRGTEESSDANPFSPVRPAEDEPDWEQFPQHSQLQDGPSCDSSGERGNSVIGFPIAGEREGVQNTKLGITAPERSSDRPKTARTSVDCNQGQAPYATRQVSGGQEKHVDKYAQLSLTNEAAAGTAVEQSRCHADVGNAPVPRGGDTNEGNSDTEEPYRNCAGKSPEDIISALRTDLAHLEKTVWSLNRRKEEQVQMLGTRLEEQERRSKQVAEDNARLIAAAQALGLPSQESSRQGNCLVARAARAGSFGSVNLKEGCSVSGQERVQSHRPSRAGGVLSSDNNPFVSFSPAEAHTPRQHFPAFEDALKSTAGGRAEGGIGGGGGGGGSIEDPQHSVFEFSIDTLSHINNHNDFGVESNIEAAVAASGVVTAAASGMIGGRPGPGSPWTTDSPCPSRGQSPFKGDRCMTLFYPGGQERERRDQEEAEALEKAAAEAFFADADATAGLKTPVKYMASGGAGSGLVVGSRGGMVGTGGGKGTPADGQRGTLCRGGHSKAGRPGGTTTPVATAVMVTSAAKVVAKAVSALEPAMMESELCDHRGSYESSVESDVDAAEPCMADFFARAVVQTEMQGPGVGCTSPCVGVSSAGKTPTSRCKRVAKEVAGDRVEGRGCQAHDKKAVNAETQTIWSIAPWESNHSGSVPAVKMSSEREEWEGSGGVFRPVACRNRSPNAVPGTADVHSSANESRRVLWASPETRKGYSSPNPSRTGRILPSANQVPCGASSVVGYEDFGTPYRGTQYSPPCSPVNLEVRSTPQNCQPSELPIAGERKENSRSSPLPSPFCSPGLSPILDMGRNARGRGCAGPKWEGYSMGIGTSRVESSSPPLLTTVRPLSPILSVGDGSSEKIEGGSLAGGTRGGGGTAPEPSRGAAGWTENESNTHMSCDTVSGGGGFSGEMTPNPVRESADKVVVSASIGRDVSHGEFSSTLKTMASLGGNFSDMPSASSLTSNERRVGERHSMSDPGLLFSDSRLLSMSQADSNRRAIPTGAENLPWELSPPSNSKRSTERPRSAPTLSQDRPKIFRTASGTTEHGSHSSGTEGIPPELVGACLAAAAEGFYHGSQRSKGPTDSLVSRSNRACWDSWTGAMAPYGQMSNDIHRQAKSFRRSLGLDPPVVVSPLTDLNQRRVNPSNRFREMQEVNVHCNDTYFSHTHGLSKANLPRPRTPPQVNFGLGSRVQGGGDENKEEDIFYQRQRLLHRAATAAAGHGGLGGTLDVRFALQDAHSTEKCGGNLQSLVDLDDRRYSDPVMWQPSVGPRGGSPLLRRNTSAYWRDKLGLTYSGVKGTGGRPLGQH